METFNHNIFASVGVVLLINSDFPVFGSTYFVQKEALNAFFACSCGLIEAQNWKKVLFGKISSLFGVIRRWYCAVSSVARHEKARFAGGLIRESQRKKSMTLILADKSAPVSNFFMGRAK